MNNEGKTFDVCFVFFTELATDARTLNFARTLVKNGKSVCVVAIGNEKDVQKFSAENIKLFPVKKPDNKKFWAKWMAYFGNSYQYREEAKAKQYFGMDLYSLFVARQLSKLHKGKLIYDSREIYSALGPLAENKIKQRILSFLEKILVKHTSEIIVSGELDAEYLKTYFKVKVPYHVFMNLPPFREPLKSDYIRKKFSITDEKTVLLYQGMLLPGRGILAIVRALPFFENAVLVLYGEGYFKQDIAEEANLLNVHRRVHFAGVAPYDELHEITCSADIGLVFIQPISLSYNLALPNKLFEYCMAGIPSLASDLPAISKIVEEYHIGKLVPHNACPQELAVALKQLAGKKENYKEACSEASKIFCYEAQEQKIMEMVD